MELKPARQCADIVEKKGFCSIECLAAMARGKQEKAKAKKQSQKKAKDLARIETLHQCISKAQKDVNKFIVTYDSIFNDGKCVATGAPISDCGHYLHRGSKYRTSWLTLSHWNLHGQSVKSNRYGDGSEAEKYRRGILRRYGRGYYVQMLRNKRLEDHKLMPKPTKDEVRACAKWHRDMTQLYKNMQI